MEIFNTHKFLYTLYHEGNIIGHTVEFEDRNGKTSKITIKEIEIGASTVSCKFFEKTGKSHRVPFVRIKQIFSKTGELVWDNTDIDTSQIKVIKGYK